MTYRIDDFRVMPRGQKIWASADIELPHYVRTAQKRALVGNIEF